MTPQQEYLAQMLRDREAAALEAHVTETPILASENAEERWVRELAAEFGATLLDESRPW